jgi:hypothetical protein
MPVDENHLLTHGVGWFLESLLQEMPVDENHLLTQGVGWFLESLLQEMPVDENHYLPRVWAGSLSPSSRRCL